MTYSNQSPIAQTRPQTDESEAIWLKQLCDYKIGLRNGCISTWPSASMRRCFFHFTKATFKNIGDMRLKTEHKMDNSDIALH